MPRQSPTGPKGLAAAAGAVAAGGGGHARHAGHAGDLGVVCGQAGRQAAEGRLVSCLCGYFILTVELVAASNSGNKAGRQKVSALLSQQQR